MIISKISWESLEAMDKSVVRVSGGVSVERIFRIPTRLRYQARPASKSATAGGIWSTESRVIMWIREPDNVYVRAFVGDIVDAGIAVTRIRANFGTRTNGNIQPGVVCLRRAIQNKYGREPVGLPYSVSWKWTTACEMG